MRGVLTRLAVALALLLAAAGPGRAADAPGGCPAQVEHATVTAERGIGGTGIDAGGAVPTTTLRGLPSAAPIGAGTLLVGTITALPAGCVAGVAVALDGRLRLRVDGSDDDAAVLHVGDVAAVEAREGARGLQAVGVAIRHEVIGPITAIAGGTIEVALQPVALAPGAQVPAGLQLGDWVAVSGLRDLSGTIHASRVDHHAAGEALVAGQPTQSGGGWLLGGLPLLLPRGVVPDGSRVLASGEFRGGTLRVDDLSDDPIVPAAGPARLVVESYVAVEGTTVSFGGGLKTGAVPGFGPPPPAGRAVLLHLARDEHGFLISVNWREKSVP